jgi:hypothetical protein
VTPAELRAEAKRLRDHAAEIAEENPSAAAYHEYRAAWCEYLADAEEQRNASCGSAQLAADWKGGA